MRNQAITAPDWLSRSAVYQINPRTFSPEGTLKSIEAELPRLKELGFGIIYLCPIFEADSSEDRTNWSDRQKKYGTENPKNPYRMNTYFSVDEEYGSMTDLQELIAAAHALGMHLLLDLVYLHIGPDAPILKRHPEFACQDTDGNIQMTIWHFPHLDFHSAGLREYLWSNMVYYVGELDADGFRCDVGDGVPLDFWAEGRRRIQSIKPDAVLINEGSNWDYLLGVFDSSYCFAWHEKLYSLFRGELTAAQLREYYETTAAQLPAGALLLRDIDNHDTVTDWPARSEIVAGHDGMEMIEVINYLLDGIPMVYSGNELADSANINMFANRFHMGRYETTDRRRLEKEDYSLRRQEMMKKLNQIKAESDLLRFGKTIWVNTDCSEEIIAFKRTYQDSALLLIGNPTDKELTVTLEEAFTGSAALTNKTEILSDTQYKLAPKGYTVLFRG